jgi:4-diphosphocytidyl-2-C-methyl-D-erythritol kinase
MDRVLVVVAGKVNLFLRVVDSCASGYHLIETLYHSIDLRDEVLMSRNDGGIRLEIEAGGIEGIPEGEENLVWRTAERFFREMGREPCVDLTLRKGIPAGAGLGGGSADAAATLQGLNLLFRSPVPEALIYHVAGELGADVPFLLYGGSALAWGRGDRLVPVDTLPPLHVGVCYPRVQISSAWAYGQLDAEGEVRYPGASIISFDRLGRENWVLSHLQNDFERVIFPLHPRLREIKEAFRDLGAEGSLLAGSGSAVFGIFRDPDRMRDALGKIGETFEADTFESSFLSQGMVIEIPAAE